jgi:hypothetical protein
MKQYAIRDVLAKAIARLKGVDHQPIGSIVEPAASARRHISATYTAKSLGTDWARSVICARG